uniref:Uncharacterized protein n=1 Tax=Caenorhabditis japonica TaxID=281687 RepID=A0A8R1IF57_CAEJA
MMIFGGICADDKSDKWDDLDVNTCVPSLTRTRRNYKLSSRRKVDDLKTVNATYLLLINEHFVRLVENNLMFERFYTVLNCIATKRELNRDAFKQSIWRANDMDPNPVQ